MKKKILIDAHFPTETRVALVDKNNLVESFEYKSDTKFQTKSNIYLAKVTRVEPSLQAAFVDYGDDKSGFLPFDEIHQDYFNVPVHVIPSGEKSDFDKKGNKNSVDDPSYGDLNKNFDDKPNKLISNEINDKDEIDIEKIKQLIDDKIQPDFDTDAYEDEIDKIKDEGEPEEERPGRIDRSGYRIQEVLKKGQILLVQVTKEERGNKGASLTTYISLAGKYSVLMPNTPEHNGISRKISNSEERKRLKGIISDLAKLNNNKASIIIRTAGAGHSSADIKRDFEYLTKLWNQIRELTLKSSAPSFIHSEDSLILKTVRDLFDKNVKEVLVQGSEAFKQCFGFVRDMMPQQISAVKEYKGKVPIFTKYSIEDQLIKLYQTNVQLPSGGYIVINPTEALISIDVNSGRSTSEKNVEETALKTNLEAAREIARQAKLRDLAGLLVLDFIDMSDVKNRKIVERALKEFLSKDKARIQTSPISMFGLLEMSRQRLRPSFLETNSKMCTHCGGKGIVRAEESNSMLILRTIENEVHNHKCEVVNVYGISSSILHLLNNKKSEINFIEDKYEIKLNFYIDAHATSDSYSIETVKAASKKSQDPISRKPLLQNDRINYVDEEVPSPGSRKKISSKRADTDEDQDHKKDNSAQRKIDDTQKTETQSKKDQRPKLKRDNQDKNQQNIRDDGSKKFPRKKINQGNAIEVKNDADKDLDRDSRKHEQDNTEANSKEVFREKAGDQNAKEMDKNQISPKQANQLEVKVEAQPEDAEKHNTPDKTNKSLDKKADASRKRINKLKKKGIHNTHYDKQKPVISNNVTASDLNQKESDSLMNASLIASELLAKGVVSKQSPSNNEMINLEPNNRITKSTQERQVVNDKKTQDEGS